MFYHTFPKKIYKRSAVQILLFVLIEAECFLNTINSTKKLIAVIIKFVKMLEYVQCHKIKYTRLFKITVLIKNKIFFYFFLNSFNTLTVSQELFIQTVAMNCKYVAINKPVKYLTLFFYINS